VSPLLLSILTFGAVVMAIGGAYSILSDVYLRDRSRVSHRIDEEFRRRQRERVKRSLLNKDLGQLAAEAEADREGWLSVSQRLEALVEQSGLNLTVARLQAITAVSGLGLGAACGLLRQSIVTGVVGALVGVAVPLFYVQYKRNARLEKLRSQLPDAFDLMGRVIRAGQTMSQALLAVADEFPQPIAGEFAYCYEQQNLGLSPENSFRDLGRRTGLLELKIFVLALLVQQQTGGNLAELLDKLSGVIRDRYRIRGMIKALTAEGRLQGAVLLALPPGMFAIMLLINRDYASVLLEHPSLITTTLVSELLGALWIRKIVNFDF
jgi:tight adherence protein B